MPGGGFLSSWHSNVWDSVVGSISGGEQTFHLGGGSHWIIGIINYMHNGGTFTLLGLSFLIVLHSFCLLLYKSMTGVAAVHM